jgi:hypothetical protein
LSQDTQEAATALAAAGVTLTVSDGAAAAACLARALDPGGTTRIAGLDGRAATDEPVTLAQPRASHPGTKGHR